MSSISYALIEENKELVIKSPLVLFKQFFIRRLIIDSHQSSINEPFYIFRSPLYAIHMPFSYIHIMFETGSKSMLGIIQSILSMYIMVRFLLTSKHLHNINFTIRSLVSIFLLSSKPGCRKIARYDVCLHSHQQASILKSIFISCPYSSS